MIEEADTSRELQLPEEPELMQVDPAIYTGIVQGTTHAFALRPIDDPESLMKRCFRITGPNGQPPVTIQVTEVVSYDEAQDVLCMEEEPAACAGPLMSGRDTELMLEKIAGGRYSRLLCCTSELSILEQRINDTMHM